MKRMLLLPAALLCLSPMTGFAANMDSGLYDPAPPPGSAFVRFVNDTDAKGSVEVKANGKRYDFLDYSEISPYYTLQKGDTDTEIGPARKTVTLEEGRFYTVVYKDGNTLNVIEDGDNDNLAKAQVVLYNLSPETNVSLQTTDGKIKVVESVAQDASAAREINPVKVSLAVYGGGGVIKDFGEVSLERGKSYSAFVFDRDDVVWTPSVTNTSR